MLEKVPGHFAPMTGWKFDISGKNQLGRISFEEYSSEKPRCLVGGGMISPPDSKPSVSERETTGLGAGDSLKEMDFVSA